MERLKFYPKANLLIKSAFLVNFLLSSCVISPTTEANKGEHKHVTTVYIGNCGYNVFEKTDGRRYVGGPNSPRCPSFESIEKERDHYFKG